VAAARGEPALDACLESCRPDTNPAFAVVISPGLELCSERESAARADEGPAGASDIPITASKTSVTVNLAADPRLHMTPPWCQGFSSLKEEVQLEQAESNLAGIRAHDLLKNGHFCM
jgi:hypothetical protein